MMHRHEATLAEALKSCGRASSADPNILKALLTIQEVLGHIPASAVSQIAETVGATEAQVAGVLSYYQDLRTEPPGRHVIRVCIGESCTANHGGQVLRALREHVRGAAGGAGQEGRFTLETASCMGNCAVSPTVMIDTDLCGRVVPSQIPSLLESYP